MREAWRQALGTHGVDIRVLLSGVSSPDAIVPGINVSVPSDTCLVGAKLAG